MSNLGAYQTFTTLAKKVGGPKILAGIIAIGGYITLRFGETGVKKGVKSIKNKITKKEYKGVIYDVIVNGKDNSGLAFSAGDKYRILEHDNNAVLIEKLGDTNNPYFVSCDFLTSISDNDAKEILM